MNNVFLFQFLFILIQLKVYCKKKQNNFTWATFEKHWDLLLPECAKRREKETNVPLTNLL